MRCHGCVAGNSYLATVSSDTRHRVQFERCRLLIPQEIAVILRNIATNPCAELEIRVEKRTRVQQQRGSWTQRSSKFTAHKARGTVLQDERFASLGGGGMLYGPGPATQLARILAWRASANGGAVRGQEISVDEMGFLWPKPDRRRTTACFSSVCY